MDLAAQIVGEPKATQPDAPQRAAPSETLLASHFRGLNRAITPHDLQPSESPRALDCGLYTRRQGILGPRLGRVAVHQDANTLDGVVSYITPQGVRQRLYTAAGTVTPTQVNADQTETALTPTQAVTSGKRMRGLQFLNHAILFNGRDRTQTFDGVSWAPAGVRNATILNPSQTSGGPLVAPVAAPETTAPAAWVAATQYKIGSTVTDGTNFYQVIQINTPASVAQIAAGVGLSAPSGAAPAVGWNTTIGATTLDNQLTWVCVTVAGGGSGPLLGKYQYAYALANSKRLDVQGRPTHGVPSPFSVVVNTVPAPVVNSAQIACVVGAAMLFQVNASNSPQQYQISQIPPGLSFDQDNGILMGTPSEPMTSTNLIITATNDAGSSTATLTITITALAATTTAAPNITSPANLTARASTGFTYQITTDNPANSYAAGGLPKGCTLNATTGLITGKITTAGTYTVTLTATAGTVAGPALTLTILVVAAGDTFIASVSPTAGAQAGGVALMLAGQNLHGSLTSEYLFGNSSCVLALEGGAPTVLPFAFLKWQGAPTGGSFQLTVVGPNATFTTASIPYNASPAVIAAAIVTASALQATQDFLSTNTTAEMKDGTPAGAAGNDCGSAANTTDGAAIITTVPYTSITPDYTNGGAGGITGGSLTQYPFNAHRISSTNVKIVTPAVAGTGNCDVTLLFNGGGAYTATLYGAYAATAGSAGAPTATAFSPAQTVWQTAQNVIITGTNFVAINPVLVTIVLPDGTQPTPQTVNPSDTTHLTIAIPNTWPIGTLSLTLKDTVTGISSIAYYYSLIPITPPVDSTGSNITVSLSQLIIGTDDYGSGVTPGADTLILYRTLQGVFGTFYQVAALPLTRSVTPGVTFHLGTLADYIDSMPDDYLQAQNAMSLNCNYAPSFEIGAVYAERVFGSGFTPIGTPATAIKLNIISGAWVTPAVVAIPNGVVGALLAVTKADGSPDASSPYTIVGLQTDSGGNVTGLQLDAAYNGGAAANGIIYRNPWEIYVSEWCNEQAWGPDGEELRFILNVPNHQAVTALSAFDGALLVFTATAMYAITCAAGAQADFSQFSITPTPVIRFGTFSQDSVMTMDDGCYFLSEQGPMCLRRGILASIGGASNGFRTVVPPQMFEGLNTDWLDGLTAAQLAQCRVGADQRALWIAVPRVTADTEATRIFRLDKLTSSPGRADLGSLLQTGGWWEERFAHVNWYYRDQDSQIAYMVSGANMLRLNSGIVDGVAPAVCSTVVECDGTPFGGCDVTLINIGGGSYPYVGAYAHFFSGIGNVYLGSRRITVMGYTSYNSVNVTRIQWSTGAATGQGALSVPVGTLVQIGSIPWFWLTRTFSEDCHAKTDLVYRMEFERGDAAAQVTVLRFIDSQCIDLGVPDLAVLDGFGGALLGVTTGLKTKRIPANLRNGDSALGISVAGQVAGMSGPAVLRHITVKSRMEEGTE